MKYIEVKLTEDQIYSLILGMRWVTQDQTPAQRSYSLRLREKLAKAIK